MIDETLVNLPKKKLIAIFNDQIFTENNYKSDELFKELHRRNLQVEEVFPRLFDTFREYEDDYYDELSYIETLSLSNIPSFFVYLLHKVNHSKVVYSLLEALGNLSWKDEHHSIYDFFTSKLEGFVDYRIDSDCTTFIARAIAFWHFDWELDFIDFDDPQITFALEDIKLIKPILFRILEYAISHNNEGILGLEAVLLIRRYKLVEAIPLLSTIMNCTSAPKGISYDERKDNFHSLREETIETLAELGEPECLPILYKALQVEPDWENFIRIVYAIGCFEEKEILSYIYAVRQGWFGRNLNYFHQGDLNEATKYALDKFGLFPSSTRYTAERLVFYPYTDFNEFERMEFIRGDFPSTREGYEKLFEYIEEHLIVANNKFIQFDDSSTFYQNFARALLYIGLPSEFLQKEKFMSQFSDSKIKAIAEKIFPYLESEKI